MDIRMWFERGNERQVSGVGRKSCQEDEDRSGPLGRCCVAPEQHLSSVNQGLGSAMEATGVTACRHEHLPSVNGNSWRDSEVGPHTEMSEPGGHFGHLNVTGHEKRGPTGLANATIAPRAVPARPNCYSACPLPFAQRQGKARAVPSRAQTFLVTN